MSKGLGYIGRTIEAVFTAQPDAAFSVDELCRLAYPGTNRIEKKHRVAVLRAAKARFNSEDYIMRSERSGGELVFYTPDNVKSYAMARMKSENHYDLGLTTGQIRERLARGGDHHRLIVPGGAWHLHTEMFKAKRDGDKKRMAKLDREQDRSLGDLVAKVNKQLA